MKNLKDYILEGVLNIGANIDSAAEITSQLLDSVDWSKYDDSKDTEKMVRDTLETVERKNPYKDKETLQANLRIMMDPVYDHYARYEMCDTIKAGCEVRWPVEYAKGDTQLLYRYLRWSRMVKNRYEYFLQFVKSKKYDRYMMESIATAVSMNVDVKTFISSKYDPGQVLSLAKCLSIGADISKIKDPKYDGGQMKQLGNAQISLPKDQFEVLLNPKLSPIKIQELTKASEYGEFDISTVDWVPFDDKQVENIVKYILQGRDVTYILDPSIPAKEMSNYRLEKIRRVRRR